ncbi:MAG: hypothetical protein II028_04950 [Clostridia bacterium]|jgi:hypothetical protein|nr:hypothetical protein [Clostridia bacterium]
MEKFVLRYRKKGYPQSVLDAVAALYGEAHGLRDCNCEIYHDFEELAVFGTDENGKIGEVTMPFSQLERWVKKLP